VDIKCAIHSFFSLGGEIKKGEVFHSTEHIKLKIHCNFRSNSLASPHIVYFSPQVSGRHLQRKFPVVCEAAYATHPSRIRRLQIGVGDECLYSILVCIFASLECFPPAFRRLLQSAAGESVLHHCIAEKTACPSVLIYMLLCHTSYTNSVPSEIVANDGLRICGMSAIYVAVICLPY